MRGSTNRKATRWATLAGAVVMMAAGLVAVQLTAATPANAVSGLERTAGFSDHNDDPVKNAYAYCPAGKRVVGGGGVVLDGGRKRVKLVQLYPVHYPMHPERPDRFQVVASAPNFERLYDWEVGAYALCADSSALSKYQIVSRDSGEPSSTTFQTAAASCPSGTVAYGAGATIAGTQSDLAGRVALQLNRTGGSGPSISRATGREDGTVSGRWAVRSLAICAEPRGQIHADGTVAAGAEASDTCDSGFTHGPGGGGGLIDGGPVWLQRIYPHNDLRTVTVRLTGPLHPSIGGMVAHQTCAL